MQVGEQEKSGDGSQKKRNVTRKLGTEKGVMLGNYRAYFSRRLSASFVFARSAFSSTAVCEFILSRQRSQRPRGESPFQNLIKGYKAFAA
jgi:hypothetical protein